MTNMDLPRVQALNAYWQRYPPMHILVAHYVGYQAPEQIEPEEQDVLPAQTLSEHDFNQLLREKGIL